jgi:hypothetical protein
MSDTPLNRALDTWAQRDDMGGFKAVAAILFPGWEAKRSCRAPHREDRKESFGVYQNEAGTWRFKDFAGEQGGIVGFVMLAGMSEVEASRWLMDGASIERIASAPRAPHFAPIAMKPPVAAPYRMSANELASCVKMAEALLGDEKSLAGIAEARGWKVETIRQLAYGPCLGLFERRPVYIYPTGAKVRHKPLSPEHAATFKGVPFSWLFGKPQSLWRADHVLAATQTLHVSEGETAAVSLIDAGLDNGVSEIVLAAASATSWRDDWGPLFQGRHVVIWPDADAAGEKLKERIIGSIGRIAQSIKVASVREVQP